MDNIPHELLYLGELEKSLDCFVKASVMHKNYSAKFPEVITDNNSTLLLKNTKTLFDLIFSQTKDVFAKNDEEKKSRDISSYERIKIIQKIIQDEKEMINNL